MGLITLKSIRFAAKHGVLPKEKRDGNEFEVDIEAELDILEAAQADELSMTFDYNRAYAVAREVMEGPSADLIETLAVRIGDRIWRDCTSLDSLTVAVRKRNPPIDGDAAWSEARQVWRR